MKTTVRSEQDHIILCQFYGYDTKEIYDKNYDKHVVDGTNPYHKNPEQYFNNPDFFPKRNTMKQQLVLPIIRKDMNISTEEIILILSPRTDEEKDIKNLLNNIRNVAEKYDYKVSAVGNYASLNEYIETMARYENNN